MNQINSIRTKTSPPIAQQHPHRLVTEWGEERIDPYFWIHDPDAPKLKAYIDAEKAYTNKMMQHTQELQKTLYDEMLACIEEDDLSLPYQYGDYLYYWRTEAGQNYGIFCRRQADAEESEEILLDGNKLAQGHKYYRLGLCEISPDQQTLAYSVDTTGNERYVLRFLNLDSFSLYPEKIADVLFFEWGNDNRTVFYTQINPNNRPDKCWRHTLGSSPTDDVLVYQENKEGFYVGVIKTRSQKYLLLTSVSIIENELFYLDANNPTGNFQSLCPLTPGVGYFGLEHHEDFFYIISNENALNQKLMKVPVTSPSKENWTTLLPHREQVLLENVLVLSDYLVFCEREAGLPRLRIQQISTGEEHYLDFPDSIYEFRFREMDNLEFDTDTLRFCYESLVTPDSIYDYNLKTRELSLQKQISVLGYDKNEYVSQRTWAIADDGKKIPVSLLYRKGLNRNGKNPLLLAGYGAYMGCEYIYFFSNRLSLLDRGFVYAVAHVRGGREMGFGWYEDGRLLNKKNTFTDFISCAEHLIEQQWTSTENLAIWGESAGGTLIGTVINMNPALCQLAIARVPLVDLLTYLSDDTLPLSRVFWDEWGNPNEQQYYDYIKSYSPYDNVTAQAYPDLLITAGLQDARVNYREPVKWTAKLRSLKTDDNLLLLKVNDSGHLGGSGRYQKLKEQAFEYAFILDRLNLSEPTK